MGWFLWGVAVGWVAGLIYHYTQRDDASNESTLNGALIIMLLLFALAAFISVGLGVQSGVIGGQPTPTPLGR